MTNCGRVQSFTVSLWLDEPLAARHGAAYIAIDDDEVLVSLDELERCEMNHAILEEFEPHDPVLFGGLTVVADRGTLGTVSSSNLNWVSEWPRLWPDQPTRIWVANDYQVELAVRSGQPTVRELWGDQRFGETTVEGYAKNVGSALLRFREWRAAILGTAGHLDTAGQAALANAIPDLGR